MSSRNEATIGTKSVARDALMIGGSLAGLFAARVLADSFSSVTILDRDIIPLTPDHRKGVPQSYHAHGLLPTAFPIIEQLFPGIINESSARVACAESCHKAAQYPHDY
jgi:hypothetical protein